MTPTGPIHYRVSGRADGLPVVLIHGFPFSSRIWESQVRTLEPSCRVLTYDVRGHGQSDPGDGQYLIEGFVDDLLELMRRVEMPSAALCGLSMGGYIALRAAEREPSSCRALVLCDTRSEADTDEARLKRAAAVRAIREKGVAEYAEAFLKQVFAPESFESRREAVEQVRGIIAATPARTLIGTLIALAARTDTTASLARLRIPALVVVGEHDAVTPVAAARALHERIAGSELAIIPGAGHLPNLERPEELNGRLLDFLQGVSRGHVACS
jgi:3-oxoadipate enol-lactonase